MLSDLQSSLVRGQQLMNSPILQKLVCWCSAASCMPDPSPASIRPSDEVANRHAAQGVVDPLLSKMI